MDVDVAIIGAGPAGVQAAIHAARKKVSVALIGKVANSATFGIEIDNYFGEGKCSGTELLKTGLEQARSFGASIVDMNVLSLGRSDRGFSISLEDGSDICARSIVLATGIRRTKLGVPGEKEFANGKGVSYCAICDCNFYKGKTVVVTGGESEAAVAAELMTKYAAKVYWVFSKFTASENLISAAKNAGVEMIEASIVKILGETKVTSVTLSDGKEVPTDGVFIELGGRSSADLAMDIDLMPEIDDSLKVDRSCSTSVPGVFACGDVTGRPWQVAKAVGEGAVAGLSAADYSKKMIQ